MLFKYFVLLFLYSTLALLISPLSTDASFRFSPKPNKAHLINWRQWGNEAFEEAKNSGKLVLLSISAVWCHWCHVMDETTYSDEQIIDLINKRFIPVRVDADMRPDIDNLYNQGGWPSTVILTPEGEIITGGTYIPPDRMIQLLRDVIEIYESKKESLKEAIERLKKERKELLKPTEESPNFVDVEIILRSIKSAFDKKYGGFGFSQKFPQADALEFLLVYYFIKRDAEVKEIIIKTLTGMANGEIFDPVEGGFFRYATQRDWTVPHYEKMLSENSHLASVYLRASSIFGNREYKSVALKTINYIMTNLYNARINLFSGSQDADEHYYRSPKRDPSKRPYVDTIAYADSNAMMITALVDAASVLQKSEYLRIAEQTARSILSKLYTKDQGIYHYWDGKRNLPGLLRDNTMAALAFLDLYESTGKKEYLQKSIEIAHLLMERFYDGTTFSLNLGTPGVSPTTAGYMLNYSKLRENYKVLLLLSRLTYYDEFFSKARDRLSRVLKSGYERFALYSSDFALGLLWMYKEPILFRVVTKKERIHDFIKNIRSFYLPLKILEIYHIDEDIRRLKSLGLPPEEALYLCIGNKCVKPIKNPSEIKNAITSVLAVQ